MPAIMEIYLQQNGQQTGPYTEEYLQNAVASGDINQLDLARREGLEEWRPLCTILAITTSSPVNVNPSAPISGTPHLPSPPTSGTPHLPPPPSASGTPHLPAPPSTSGTPHLDPPLPPPDFARAPAQQLKPLSPGVFSKVSKSILQQGASIGGWACFLVGFIVLIGGSWPFYIHFAFFVAALILSIEVLSQRKIIGGVSLLLATLVMPVFVGFGMLFYQINKSVEPDSGGSEKMQVEQKGE